MKAGKPPSSSTKDKSQRSKREITPDEADLWSQVTGSVGRVAAKQRVSAGGKSSDDKTGGNAAEGSSKPRQSRLRTSEPPSPAAPRQVSPPAPPKPPPLAQFDRRKVRHIASGKVEIDARLDLHGARQGEARQRLRGFLVSAQERGLRTVLVITGKGSANAPDPLANALGEPQRGVLRRLVPQWLDEPDLRPLVIGFTSAAQRHGGEGAFYVRLRRPGRAQS